MKFLVNIHGFTASNFITQHEESDKVSLSVEFDEFSFRPRSLVFITQREAHCEFDKSFIFEIPEDEIPTTFLQQRTLSIRCWHKTPNPCSDRQFAGAVLVDLHTIATGSIEQNLPLINNDTEVGRLQFFISMEQFSQVRVHFDFIRVTHLLPLKGHTRIHPFLRYGFSEAWRKDNLFESTEVAEDGEDLEWTNIPDLKFVTSHPRLQRGSIKVVICHQGTLMNDEYARIMINLRQADILEEGEEFEFCTNLHNEEGTIIQGKFTVHNVPTFQQQYPTQREKSIPHFVELEEEEQLQQEGIICSNACFAELPHMTSKLWKSLKETNDNSSAMFYKSIKKSSWKRWTRNEYQGLDTQPKNGVSWHDVLSSIPMMY